MIKRALISVDNLNDIEAFARKLKQMGWHIIASAESVKRLKKNNIKVEDVSNFTGVKQDYGFPPTLHPKMEAALTKDVKYRIDLVYDIPYGFKKGHDVGGNTLLALAAKGKRIPVFSPADMKQVIKELWICPQHLKINPDLHQELIDKANAHIAGHFLSLIKGKKYSSYDGWFGRLYLELLNGENPYQVPANLLISQTSDKLSLDKFSLHGSLPCFTNLADLDSVINIMCFASEAFRRNLGKIPYIAIAAKHGNPCGMAIDWNRPEHAVNKALFGNPMAIWGGEFVVNFKIDSILASLLKESKKREKTCKNKYWMLDVIAAPDFDAGVVEILSKNSSRKLFSNKTLFVPKLYPSWQYRQIRGGFLRQPPPHYILDFKKVSFIDVENIKRNLDSLILAWSVVYGSNHGGNEVALAKDRQLLAAGGGPSTREATATAILRARNCKHKTKDSVFAADAFFPFLDAPQLLKRAGCCVGIFPAGGKNESAVKEYFKSNKVEAVYIPAKYRGFCRH